MKRAIWLCALLTAALAASAAVADEMDGWCAQVKKGSSIVICSDPELRQQAAARNKLFETAREILSPEAYKALTQDQSRWIRSYTTRCGALINGPAPPQPIPQSVFDCYRRASRARTADLTASLSEPNPVASTAPLKPAPSEILTRPLAGTETNSAPSLPPCNSPAGEATIRGSGGGCELRPPLRSLNSPAATAPSPPTAALPPQYQAWLAWRECTEHAIDMFATQPEGAGDVAVAAMASCMLEGFQYLQVAGELKAAGVDAFTRLKDSDKPDLMARVMAVRAGRAMLLRGTSAPPVDYNRM